MKVDRSHDDSSREGPVLEKRTVRLQAYLTPSLAAEVKQERRERGVLLSMSDTLFELVDEGLRFRKAMRTSKQLVRRRA